MTSVAIDAPSYSAGDVVTVNATLKNQGTSDVNRSFTAVYELDGVVIGTVIVQNLSAGASVNVSLNWTVLPGTHVLGVEVDPVGVVPESNEGNNGGSLTVANVAGPDLTVESVTMQPGTAEDGDFVNLTVAETEYPFHYRRLCLCQRSLLSTHRDRCSNHILAYQCVWNPFSSHEIGQLVCYPDEYSCYRVENPYQQLHGS